MPNSTNVKDFDILAINRTTYEQFAIQVKTTGYKQKKWTLSKKNETLVGDNIVYVFVSLNELDVPEYHIVPSKIVAETIKNFHQNWLDTPGKKGQQRNDTNIRNFFDKDDKYLNCWDWLDYKKLQNCQFNREKPSQKCGGFIFLPTTIYGTNPFQKYATIVLVETCQIKGDAMGRRQ